MYKHLISQFRQFSVLVIGDLMLDVYLKGASTRLTPEATVPVVDILNNSTVPGGAANTAANLKHLGAAVTFCSICGADEYSEKAQALLSATGVTCRILRDPERSTLVKTRVMSGKQLLIRYDSGSVHQISAEQEQAFIVLLEEQYPLHDAIVIADYNKGLITPGVIAALQALNRRREKFIAVDSRRLEAFRSLSPSLVKPNYAETVQLLQIATKYEARARQLQESGAAMFAATGAAITAATLDEEGAVIFAGNQLAYRSHAHEVPPLNVAGAGDAYISAFTLACLAGADIPAAAEVSAAAAAVAVSKHTTACCTCEELTAYLSVNEKYVTDPQQLAYISAIYKSQGKKIVFTNGCFDILHSGHVNYLNRARELGHILMVGINTDDSIRRLKGSSRPINTLEDRMEVLGGLGAVHHIIPFGSEAEDTAAPLISLIKPDVFVKGGDYTRATLPEAGLVEEQGGEVIILPLLPDRSTTLIVNRIHTTHNLKRV
ncbi:PfkB family carbohydrate kinase [Chitinophaga nivalis]|uniref:PfkB family carbohydrate kinase n=1 Tax=Chitinophaga nivalis TaxID=2991709 RepID=A0ABT3II37_9BACT|nr:PfkB family carbohydrate kinase [Chitinophaga nivalis]MCW3466687.1 PfkB family carbohydrate kinase [Chitinophaga nivalis]MCW3483622.1 PfkB family carbohydrate kinase [Chitinophaga nivalis]